MDKKVITKEENVKTSGLQKVENDIYSWLETNREKGHHPSFIASFLCWKGNGDVSRPLDWVYWGDKDILDLIWHVITLKYRLTKYIEESGFDIDMKQLWSDLDEIINPDNHCYPYDDLSLNLHLRMKYGRGGWRKKEKEE